MYFIIGITVYIIGYFITAGIFHKEKERFGMALIWVLMFIIYPFVWLIEHRDIIINNWLKRRIKRWIKRVSYYGFYPIWKPFNLLYKLGVRLNKDN